MTSPRPLRPRVSVCRMLAALALLPLPALAAPPGAESPQALVARLRPAVANNDVAEIAACIEPSQRRAWAVAMLRRGETMMQFLGEGDGGEGAAAGPAGVAAASERIDAFKARPERISMPAELHAFYQAILEKHGLASRLGGKRLDSSPAGMDRLLAGVDEAALIADLTALVDSLLDPARREHGAAFPAEVTDYRLTGDRAVAKAGGDEYRFVRVAGRWYQVMPAREP